MRRTRWIIVGSGRTRSRPSRRSTSPPSHLQLADPSAACPSTLHHTSLIDGSATTCRRMRLACRLRRSRLNSSSSNRSSSSNNLRISSSLRCSSSNSSDVLLHHLLSGRRSSSASLLVEEDNGILLSRRDEAWWSAAAATSRLDHLRDKLLRRRSGTTNSRLNSTTRHRDLRMPMGAEGGWHRATVQRTVAGQIVATLGRRAGEREAAAGGCRLARCAPLRLLVEWGELGSHRRNADDPHLRRARRGDDLHRRRLLDCRTE